MTIPSKCAFSLACFPCIHICTIQTFPWQNTASVQAMGSCAMLHAMPQNSTATQRTTANALQVDTRHESTTPRHWTAARSSVMLLVFPGSRNDVVTLQNPSGSEHVAPPQPQSHLHCGTGEAASREQAPLKPQNRPQPTTASATTVAFMSRSAVTPAPSASKGHCRVTRWLPDCHWQLNQLFTSQLTSVHAAGS
jgi:hypothetical protein